MRKIDLPTGYIIINDYQKGQLETLSIGDYGKSKNIKADFLGYRNEINGVMNGTCMPLTEKWVMTLSTQYGCPMSCTFCDAHKVKFNGNATIDDLINQTVAARYCFPEVSYTDRLNIHFARMGEPSFNYNNIFDYCSWLHNKKRFQRMSELRVECIHPVFTTMMPKSLYPRLTEILHSWTCDVKNFMFRGQAGLQLSINSTDKDQRESMFNGRAMDLTDISKMCQDLDEPLGRKYCLNFAISDETIIDAQYLSQLFDSEKFMCKITPIHNTNACKTKGLVTTDGYNSFNPYKKVEKELTEAGFDVIVFIPSMDEENGCVTCGNAILGGSTLNV